MGSTAGQIGKLKGCRIVGIAGGNEKCSYAKEVLGFDECLDHKSIVSIFSFETIDNTSLAK